MKNSIHIRPLHVDDLPGAKHIIEENQMFPAEMLDEMTQAFLQDKHPENAEFWCVATDDSKQLLAVAYCAPEYMTNNTWNLLLIAVIPSAQGTGIGSALMSHMEQQAKHRQGRLLLVETSGLPDFAKTREFYPKCGYLQVAVIPEYYDSGDDKVVFSKNL